MLFEWGIDNVIAITSECHHTPGSSPSHRKRPKIRNMQCFSDMVSSHSAGALYQDIRALACIPGVLKKVIQPIPKLSNMVALKFLAQNGGTDLQKALLQERDRECAVLDTYSHEFCWIATNVPEFNPMLSIESERCFEERKHYPPTRSTPGILRGWLFYTDDHRP
jgi:hypothetical protein